MTSHRSQEKWRWIKIVMHILLNVDLEIRKMVGLWVNMFQPDIQCNSFLLLLSDSTVCLFSNRKEEMGVGMMRLEKKEPADCLHSLALRSLSCH